MWPLQIMMYICIAIIGFYINKTCQLAIMNYISKCGWEYPERVQLVKNLPNPSVQTRLLCEFQTMCFSSCWTSLPECHTQQDPQFILSFSHRSLYFFWIISMTCSPDTPKGPKPQRIPIWLPSTPTLRKCLCYRSQTFSMLKDFLPSSSNFSAIFYMIKPVSSFFLKYFPPLALWWHISFVLPLPLLANLYNFYWRLSICWLSSSTGPGNVGFLQGLIPGLFLLSIQFFFR